MHIHTHTYFIVLSTNQTSLPLSYPINPLRPSTVHWPFRSLPPPPSPVTGPSHVPEPIIAPQSLSPVTYPCRCLVTPLH